MSDIKIKLFFKWFDMWVGIYIDKIDRAIYICPLPMLGIKIWKPKAKTAQEAHFQQKLTAAIYLFRDELRKTPSDPINYDNLCHAAKVNCESLVSDILWWERYK